ncbi:hypothetical protein Salat_2158000 [Sesamum alatum]|uniref:Reverse transcriptase n=1 Tax=Sesamum alatum TaxID=300844 RepID=A0AAE1Y2K4_9LAMI|nr:hypothetical protein Salat_2158000 [Sesamum alatum]
MPVGYLGIPLAAQWLSIIDCSSLVDKIANNISKWAAKSLSFAGRLELIEEGRFTTLSMACRHSKGLETSKAYEYLRSKITRQPWQTVIWKAFTRRSTHLYCGLDYGEGSLHATD